MGVNSECQRKFVAELCPSAVFACGDLLDVSGFWSIRSQVRMRFRAIVFLVFANVLRQPIYLILVSRLLASLHPVPSSGIGLGEKQVSDRFDAKYPRFESAGPHRSVPRKNRCLAIPSNRTEGHATRSGWS